MATKPPRHALPQAQEPPPLPERSDLRWPQLATWSLANLLRLQASWQQITPGTPEEWASHTASLAELATYIARYTEAEHYPRPKEP